MPRKPKAKNTLSAGERVALYEAELAKKNIEQGIVASPMQERSDATAPANKVTLDVKKNASMPKNDGRAPKKSKQKPRSTTVRVDFSVPVGTVKPMHGMCNGPLSYGADISRLFGEIGAPFVRFDSSDTAAGTYSVDVSRVFRDLRKDPADPESYDFTYADRCVEAALGSGARVILGLGKGRDLFGVLGEDNELSADVDLLARVCVNVIRHYNDGWARGAHYGIEYFELPSSSGDVSLDAERYGRLANLVKIYDENIKIGGICFTEASEAREFLKICKRKRYPIDFITLECFSGDVERVCDELEGLVSSAKNLGFAELEIIIGKWMFADKRVIGDTPLRSALSVSGKAASVRSELVAAQRSVVGAAYASALMLRLNSIDGVATACFFDAQPAVSPFCSLTDDLGAPQKPFYAFKAFGELYKAKNAVLSSVDRPEGFAHSGIYVSAALSDGGEGVVCLASFEGCGVVDLRLDGISEDMFSAEVYMLDGVKNLVSGGTVPLSGAKKRMVFNLSEYGVILIKLY